MAELSEYLGHILCEITRARAMADAEAVRVAKSYVNDPSELLRHFPTPRMRLPKIEISVPIAIRAVPDGYQEKTAGDPVLLGKIIADEIGPALKKEGVHISTAEITKIIKTDPALSRGILDDNIARNLSAKLYDHTKTTAFKQKVQEKGAATTTGELFKKVSRLISEGITRAIEDLPRKPIGITVETETAKLRELGDPAQLLTCKLVISEDALDIHLDDDTGDSSQTSEKKKVPTIKRLVPE